LGIKVRQGGGRTLRLLATEKKKGEENLKQRTSCTRRKRKTNKGTLPCARKNARVRRLKINKEDKEKRKLSNKRKEKRSRTLPGREEKKKPGKLPKEGRFTGACKTNGAVEVRIRTI